MPGRERRAALVTIRTPSDNIPVTRTTKPAVRMQRTAGFVTGGLALGRLRFGGGVGCRSVVLIEHRLERQLAAVVDLRDAHEDLLADTEHVFDVLDALATGELADLADVQQAV